MNLAEYSDMDLIKEIKHRGLLENIILIEYYPDEKGVYHIPTNSKVIGHNIILKPQKKVSQYDPAPTRKINVLLAIEVYNVK